MLPVHGKAEGQIRPPWEHIPQPDHHTSSEFRLKLIKSNNSTHLGRGPCCSSS